MVIKTKIIAIIAITILISVGVTTGILIHIQRSQMEEHASKEGELITDVIHRSIDHAMLLGRTREVQSIIENLGKNEELIAVRILSLRGEILKSSEPSEIGLKAADFSSGAAPAGRVIKTNGKDILVFSKPIDNKKTCFRCHDHKEKINGIIQIEQDLSRNSATLASLKEILLSSNIALVILVSALLSVLFTKFVTKPLKGLLLTIKDIEAGNWDATVTVRSNDELGLIGSSFNAMIREMKALYKKDVTKERELANIRIKLEHKTKVEELNTQLEYKLQELETANKAISSLSKEVKGKNLQLEKAIERLKKINEVGTTLTSIIETAELMKIIIRSTADLIKADRITMHLNGKKRTPLTLQYQRGLGIDHLTDVSMEFNSTYSDILKRGKSIHHSEAPGNQATDLSGSIARIGVPLKMQGQIIGALVLENNNGGVRFTEDELELLTTIANQAMVAVENALLYETVKANYFAAIQSLINALEANDKFTKGHSERVTLLSLELARYIGLDYILQKRGKLTADEYALVQAHPAIGNEILKPIQTLDNIRMIIIQHHERYDGKGYPNSLKGSEISLKSKILSVVDTFDAMMTDRPYRNALTMEEALDELKTHSGTQFDPYVVQMFIDMLKSKGDEFLASIGYDALQSVSYDSQ
jgi:HD-GYP domain-containing protein (c-di-GMP phosphodiesterase class II)